jgi:nucleolar protein 9
MSSDRSTFPRNNDIDWSKIQKPRKVDADLLTYFKEVEHLLENPEEDLDQELLLQNIYDEMKNHEASLASDKKGSQIMEKLIARSTPVQIRSFFSGCKGYFAFLATNRYSSHVLQKIMGLVGQIIQDELSGGGSAEKDEEEEEEEDKNEVPDMRTLISACFDELMGGVQWVWLMQDISGSHVLRSLVCILSGRKLVADKRGKNAKHKEPEKHGSGDTVYNVPSEFADMLTTVVNDLMDSDSDKLLELSCDSNASPLLQMLLRLHKHETQKMQPFVKQLLHWDEKAASVDAVWNLSAEQTGSHVVEAVLECCEDDFVEELYHRCLKGHLVDYAAHPVSNYVVQQLCIRSTASLIEGIAVELMSEGGIASLLTQKRSGIVWRLIEACVLHNTKVREVCKSIFTAVNADAKKQGAAFGGGKVMGFTAALLKLRLPASSSAGATSGGGSSSDGRLWLDVPGAHIFEHLMSETVCTQVGKTVCRPALESFLSMTTEELVAMAKDNVSSRYEMMRIYIKVEQVFTLSVYTVLSCRYTHSLSVCIGSCVLKMMIWKKADTSCLMCLHDERIVPN